MRMARCGRPRRSGDDGVVAVLVRATRVVALAALAGSIWAGSARASSDPWEARLPDGRSLHIVQDSSRSDATHLIVRRLRDGREDPQYGPSGGVPLRLGADDASPEQLRADGLGRAWVAGAATTEGRTQAVVLRFAPHGVPDAGFGRAGRSAVMPAGKGARAIELQPLPDGSTWVAGTVIDAPGDERAGWWRLAPDGSLDPRFGAGGLWEGPRGSEPVTLEVGPTGSAAYLLRRAGDGQTYELWTIDGFPAARAPTPSAVVRSTGEPPALHWSQGWKLAGGERLAPASGDAPPASLAGAASEAGDAASTHRMSDFPVLAPSRPAARTPAADDDGPPAAWLAAAIAAAALLVAWTWRRLAARNRTHRRRGR